MVRPDADTNLSRPWQTSARSADEPARDLLLSFTATADGLVFLAYWKQGRNRIPALGQHHRASDRGRAARKLIALASYARKARFRYNQTTHAYAMESLADIPGFLRDVLPHWKKQFGDRARRQGREPQAGARGPSRSRPWRTSAAGPGWISRWIFRAGEKLLTDEQAATLLKHGRTPVLMPDLGILTMSPEKWESFNQWRRTLEETQADGALPPYLVFSLFNDTRIKVTLGPEIEAWRQKVLTPPAGPAGVAGFPAATTSAAASSGCTTSSRRTATACSPTRWASARPRRSSPCCARGRWRTGRISSCARRASCRCGARRSRDFIREAKSTC